MARRYRKRAGQSGAVRLAVGAVFVALVAAILFARVFVLKNIVVLGNAQDTGRIVTQSGLMLGQSIFSIDEGAVLRAFERDGQLDAVKVEVKLPDRVELTVNARSVFAAVDYLGTAVLIDAKACVMSQQPNLPTDDTIIVTGVSAMTPAVGRPLQSTVYGQIEAMKAVLTQIEARALKGEISELNVENLDNLYLVTRGGMQVKLGGEDGMADKLYKFDALRATLALEGKTGGSLDVSGKDAIYSAKRRG